MSATYWVLVSDELMKTKPPWPAGLRPVQSDDRHPDNPGMRWWLFEDDDAPPELDRKDVNLVFRDEDGKPVLAERRVIA